MRKVIRVLMVDDNKEHVNLCVEYLPKDDFALDPAYTAMEALGKLKEYQYDIIVLDYDLPDMNGLDLMKKIKPLSLNVPMILTLQIFKTSYLYLFDNLFAV